MVLAFLIRSVSMETDIFTPICLISTMSGSVDGIRNSSIAFLGVIKWPGLPLLASNVRHVFIS